MNAFERRVSYRVFGIHVAVVAGLTVFPMLKGCFRPKPKQEIVTFIEFGAPAPQVEVETVSQLAEPEPPPPAPPPPQNDIPEPTPIPEPVKKKIEPPKKVEPPKLKKPEEPKPKPPEPEKPEWKPVDPKDIKIGKKIEPKPTKPAVSASEISKALAGVQSSRTSLGTPGQFNDYYVRVMNALYGRWVPPVTAATGTSMTVRIHILKNGQVVKRVPISGSGNAAFDTTVMDAVNAVSTLPAPPSDYPYDYVEVTFTKDN